MRALARASTMDELAARAAACAEREAFTAAAAALCQAADEHRRAAENLRARAEELDMLAPEPVRGLRILQGGK